jgi:hypothetical protein
VLLTLNVLQTNREYQRTSDLIRRINPDILLLMKFDQAWADAMAPIMEHIRSDPLVRSNLAPMALCLRQRLGDERRDIEHGAKGHTVEFCQSNGGQLVPYDRPSALLTFSQEHRGVMPKLSLQQNERV